MVNINALSGVSDVLEKISGQLLKIETSQKNITSTMPKVLGGFGGGGFSGAGGGSTGGTGASPGNSMPVPSFGGSGAASPGGAGVTPPLFTSKAAIATLAVAGTMWAAAPNPTSVMNNAARFYGVGLGTPGYNANAFQQQMLTNMQGGIRNPEDIGVTAGILNSYGIGPTQSIMGQASQDVATLNRAFNWDTSVSSQMIGTMSTGAWTGGAYRFGLNLSDAKGNPLSMDQQFSQIYNRLWGGSKPTAEGIQQMYRAGGLQYQLQGLGMDATMQEAFLKSAMDRANGGTGAIAGLETEGNKNPLASSFKVGQTEATKMVDATDAVINGYETAAEIISKVNEAYMQLPDLARDLVNYTKAAKQGLSSNATTSGIGGVLKAAGAAMVPGFFGYAGMRAGARAAGGGGSGGGGFGFLGGSGGKFLGSTAGKFAGGAVGGLISGYQGFQAEKDGEGVWGGLLSSLGVGAVAGGAMGAFAGGVGAIPGALIGGAIGGGGYLLGRALGHDWDGGGGHGDGPDMTGNFSAGSIFSPSSSGFDEASALTSFNVRSSPTSHPSTMMGWISAQMAAGAASSTTAGAASSGGSSSGSSGGSNGRTIIDKRQARKSIKRGKWVTISTLSIAKGKRWSLEGQLNFDITSAKGRKPAWVKTRWVRDGWGAESTDGSGDVTGADTHTVPSRIGAYYPLSMRPHVISGGGRVLLQVQVEGSGSIDMTLILAKAVPVGGETSRGGTDRSGSSGAAAGDGSGKSPGSVSGKGTSGLADWFEDHLGESYNPLTKKSFSRACLANVRAAVQHLGGKFVSSNYAYQATDRVEKKGEMHYNDDAPRNAILFWNNSVGSGAGHVAVSDGKGNALNNWGGATNDRTSLSRMKKGYVGWAPASALSSYSQGAWNISKDETANIHSGEMILNAENAQIMRNAIREVMAGQNGGGRKVEVNLKITNATDAEAIQFAHKVKALIEEDSMLERMGSR